MLQIEQAEEVARFQALLGRDYELVGREMTSVVQVFVGDQTVEHPQPPRPETLWRFAHTSGGWSVALTPSALGFEATQYERFDVFVDEYQRVVSALGEVFEPPSQRRLGVRYINEIRDPRVRAEHLQELIAVPLLGLMGTDLGYDLVSSLAEWRFQQPDGFVVVRHGTVEPEAYLLDYDYFSEDVLPFDPAAIRERVAAYHAVIESLFVWSLTEEYLTELRTPVQANGD